MLLRAFAARGWEVQGTELSEAAAGAARALGYPVHVGSPGSARWADGSFDAVTMWHTLEHWPEPAEALVQVARLLRPGGVLLVGVPNFGSPEALLARAAWFHLDVPRHLVHFTPATLEAALAARGLAVRARSFVAPEFDLFSFVQSALNLLGLRHNALYDLLRGRSGAGRARGGAWPALVSLAGAVPLGLLALPVTLLLSLAGRGSSMAVLAVKGAG